MNEPQKRFPLRLLVMITSPKLEERARGLFRQSRLPIVYHLRGQGTATSEMTDMLGLGGTAKAVTICMLPKVFAGPMLDRLDRELDLGRPDTGVAFTTAITGINSPAMKLMDEKIREELKDTMESDMRQMTANSAHSLIIAAVNQGYSEEVMEAARSAGARGGTVLHARQAGGEEGMRFWGITIQEEKELVMILADSETKLAIMKAVSEKCGVHCEARGIVISTPIDRIAGFERG